MSSWFEYTACKGCGAQTPMTDNTQSEVGILCGDCRIRRRYRLPGLKSLDERIEQCREDLAALEEQRRVAGLRVPGHTVLDNDGTFQATSATRGRC